MTTERRSVFIAGGTGYIGQRLVLRLLERGHQVRALVRPGSERKLPEGCTAVIGNALDGASYALKISPADTFVQLVGVAHPSPAKAAEFQKIDRPAGLGAIAAAKEASIRHFVYVSVAHPARVYNYLLGGKDNFAADREAARQMIAGGAKVLVGVRANRAFLGRAVRYLAANGISQFLDIGSGIPTEGNVHEVAQQASPAAQVAYVDIDQVAVAHSKAMLAGNQHATVVEADVRDPERILELLLPSFVPVAYAIGPLTSWMARSTTAGGFQ